MIPSRPVIQRTALALAIVLLLVSASALASGAGSDHVTARLEYKRGPGTEACPDERGLRLEVARRAGLDPFAPDARARLVATVTRKGPQLIGALQFYDDAGAPGWSKASTVRANDCRTLMEVMGADIEVEFFPSPVIPAPPSSPPPLPPSMPPPEPPPPPEPISLVIRLGPTLVFGAAPRAEVGLLGDVGFNIPLTALPIDGVSFAMGVRWDPQAAGQVTGQPDAVRLMTSVLLGTAVPCVHRWKLYGCFVAEIGRLWTEGEGIANPGHEGAKLYAATGGRLGVEVPFAPHLRFHFFGELLRTLTRVTIPIDEGPGWTAPPVSGGIGTGLSFVL